MTDYSMLKYIDNILRKFRPCFSRKAPFEWFAISIVGVMNRSDHLGVSSIIRGLSLAPKYYESIIHFFRSTAWRPKMIRETWFRIVKRLAPLHRINGAVVLIGDGTKQAKEAQKMPGVKRLYQESENSSKARYIFGHMFGGIGILAGNSLKKFCVPLCMTIQDGIKAIFGWLKPKERQSSHVIQVIEQAIEASKIFGKAKLLLDRYFLSTNVLNRLEEANQSEGVSLDIVTQAKSSTVAYEPPEKKKQNGRGRPRKKGAAVKLKELFNTRSAEFKSATVTVYGKEETIQYLCLDLLWGQGLYQQLRFVLVRWKDCRQSILVSTDLTLEATDIVTLYGYRFKIECMFREMKQQVGAFCYRFWSKSVPKLKRYLKKDSPDPLEQVTDERARNNIQRTVRAIEGFVMICCIATGVLQLSALRFSAEDLGRIRYLRTPSKGVVSEATVMTYLRTCIFRMFDENRHLTISQIIRSKQEFPYFDGDVSAS